MQCFLLSFFAAPVWRDAGSNEEVYPFIRDFYSRCGTGRVLRLARDGTASHGENTSEPFGVEY